MATLSGTTSSSSSSSSSLSSTTTSVSHHTDVAECWICRDSESTQDNPILHGVCRCIGSIGHVHQHCVDQWVFAQKHECCPSCLTAYRIDSATYPAGVIFPKTPKEELRCVVKYLILPLMWSAMRLALSAGINFLLQCIITPLIIGFSFHGDVASLAGVLRMEEGATFIFPQLRWTEWLCWLTYGLICIFAVHGTIAGWRQWQDFFRDHPNIPAGGGGGGGGGAAMDAAAGAAGGGGAQLEFTPVESIFAMLEHNYATYHLSLKSASRCALNLGVSIPVSLIARTTTGKLVALVAFAVICIAWRLFFPAKTLKDPRRRFDEVGERKGEATPRDVRLWFITYVVEFLCFSVTLPLVGGIVLHYAVSPYFATFTRESFMESFDELHLVLYWALGTGCSFVLLHVESSVIVALFAPGVDLFYVRSVDFNFDTEGIYWRCVLTQVFVADPLRVVLEFVRLIFIDGLVLLFFVSAPLWCGFHLREMIWHDVSEGRISFPLPVGFPAYRPGGLTGNATIEDWMQLQQIEAINASFVKGGVLALTNATAALATAAGSAAMVGSSVAYLVKYADAALASVDDNTSYSYLPHFSFLSQEWLLGMSAAGHLCSVSALATRPWGPDETSHLRLVHDHIHNLLPDDPMAAQAHLQKSLDDQRRLLAQKFSDGLIPANLIHYDDAVGCVALSHRYGLSFLAINIWGEAFDFLSWIPASFYYVTIKHPAYGTWFIDGFNLVAIFTTLACFAFTPIQRAQLKVLRPFVGVLARLFQMEEFLLDPEREEILDHFLHGVDMGEELLMPPMTPAMVFTRRERVVPPEKIPAHLSLRLAGLSILFLIGSTALVWAIPILLMNAALCVVPYTVPILVATSCVLFYAISPQHFWENVFVACAMLVLLFAWPAVEGTLKARNMLVSVVGSRGSIVRWTMEYRFRIRRQVGLMLNETETEEWTTDEDW